LLLWIGRGDEVTKGKSVQFLWILHRANGYFVASSAAEPFIYRVGDLKKTIAGLDEGLRGMKVGGIRRISTPPALSFVQGVAEGMPGPLPTDFGPKRQIVTRQAREVWKWEVKLLKAH
jgi:FKBP-type peptidyl-prolyl cis-trans isomerase